MILRILELTYSRVSVHHDVIMHAILFSGAATSSDQVTGGSERN